MKTARWIFCFLAAAIPLRAESVNVAAAADLNFAIQEIIQQFEHDTGNVVHLTLGSSGNFYAQILNGAPFDVFLSADTEYPKQLEQQGYAIPSNSSSKDTLCPDPHFPMAWAASFCGYQSGRLWT